MNQTAVEEFSTSIPTTQQSPRFDSRRQPFKASDYKILLIDDDFDQLEMFCFLLQGAGFCVSRCSSAPEAIDKIKSEPFDLIVSDLKMPRFGGEDLIRSLRSFKPFGKLSEIPVIILTCASADSEMALIELGANMFCRKKDAWRLLIPQIKFLLR